MANTGKSTGPLSSMSIDDTFVIIELWQGHHVLWDIRRPEYRNQLAKRASWTSMQVNIQERLGIVCSVENIQRKTASLRNTFTRELRLIKSSKKSGAGTDDIRKTSWPFFAALEFLRPVVVINCPTVSNHPSDSTEDILPQKAEDIDVPEQVLPEEPGNVEIEVPKSKSKRKLYDSDPLEKSLTQFIEERRKKVTDPLTIWSHNLVENLKSLNPKRRKLLKLEIDELLCKAMREDIENDSD